MALRLPFKRSTPKKRHVNSKDFISLLEGFSIEVMPRTAAKITNFESIVPNNTNIYIAHLEGTPISDMLQTASNIKKAGFPIVPHFPARIIKDKATLENWISRYSSIGIDKALVLAGSSKKPIGEFSNSMELLDTGLFEKYGFTEIFCAGHPEGNKDIDVNGSDKNLIEALRWKQDFSRKTNIKLSITTQFCFEIKPIIEWEQKLSKAKIDLPINIGIAGPAKLQTMIKYALLCGVGPSIRVLEKRAKDLTQLILPYTPGNFLEEIVAYKMLNQESNIKFLHFFPLGGITNTTDYINKTKLQNSVLTKQ